MLCNVIEDIREGAEIVVCYHKHYFGDFNVNCLCPFKSKHHEYFSDKLPRTRMTKKRKTYEIILLCQRVKTISNISTTFRPLLWQFLNAQIIFISICMLNLRKNNRSYQDRTIIEIVHNRSAVFFDLNFGQFLLEPMLT